MTFLQPQNYQLKKISDMKSLISNLSEKFMVAKTPIVSNEFTLYDDFDSNIWHAGALLTHTAEGVFELISKDGSINKEMSHPGTYFWWDFDAGPFRDQLQKMIDLRAVNPLESFKIDASNIHLKDAEEKTLVRIKQIFLTDNGEKCCYLSIQPLRGYGEEFKTAVNVITAIANQSIEKLDIRSIVLKHGYSPSTPPVRVFALHKRVEAEECLRKMSHELLVTTRTHEDGIINDIDTEFLHQYRVNFRKVRSLVNLLKRTLAETDYLNFKERLSKIAGRTNSLRDLDVFLLSKNDYLAMLPESSQSGLEALFEKVATQRKKEQRSLSNWLTSKTYKSAIDKLIEDFNLPAKKQTALASQNIYEVASKLIFKRFKKVKLLGQAIDDHTPDDDVHELRIECKKLRYLMEYFSDLYPKESIKSLIKNLKSLQTILGDFNDCCVQKEILVSYDQSFGKDKSISNSIHSLIAVIHQMQLSKRSEVKSAFAQFGSVKTHEEFTRLFSH